MKNEKIEFLINCQEYSEAKKILKRLLLKNKVNINTLYFLALAEEGLGNTIEAITLLSRILIIEPNHAEAHYTSARLLIKLEKHADAMFHHNFAASLLPTNPWVFINRGNSFAALKRFHDALRDFDAAIEIDSMSSVAYQNKGSALFELGFFEDSLLSLDKAINLNPINVNALSNKSACLLKLKLPDKSLIIANSAIKLEPDFAEAWSNRGNALNDLKRHEEALSSYDKSISLKPDFAEAWSNRGNALNDLKRHEESAASFLKAHEFLETPDFHLGRAHHQMLLACDWKNFDLFKKQLDSGVKEGKYYAEPFGYQGIADSEQLLGICAKLYCQKKYPTKKLVGPKIKNLGQKIRIGYLCGEFRNQATSHLMTGVWESHDHAVFEIFAFDNGWNDCSDYRSRIKLAIPNFFEISQISDFRVEELIAENKIDILVNLNGYFGKCRQNVFAARPAPIAVNYLGFPGTIGADYIDYLIADQVCIPESSKDYYSEKIAYLPYCYQANDNNKKISNRLISRNEFDLPENAFVFCCFNNNYKITPQTFQLWMEILSEIENSCLWLMEDNHSAKKNLKNEASRQGIDPNRLIFAKRIELSEHINRHKLADLFLDTLPYNAHTTASDALWAGLPILTLKGNTFPGRVGASLLKALDLTELITSSTLEYKEMAILLAKNPDKLESIKMKLKLNKLSSPLFDTVRFTRYLEAAYHKMYERYLTDLPPDHIYIDS
jgi:predicted O-linked N-acetylglucosamine transferase (SPINDLY family)